MDLRWRDNRAPPARRIASCARSYVCFGPVTPVAVARDRLVYTARYRAMRQGVRAQIPQEQLARNKRRSERSSRCAARAALDIRNTANPKPSIYTLKPLLTPASIHGDYASPAHILKDERNGQTPRPQASPCTMLSARQALHADNCDPPASAPVPQPSPCPPGYPQPTPCRSSATLSLASLGTDARPLALVDRTERHNA